MGKKFSILLLGGFLCLFISPPASAQTVFIVMPSGLGLLTNKLTAKVGDNVFWMANPTDTYGPYDITFAAEAHVTPLSMKFSLPGTYSFTVKSHWALGVGPWDGTLVITNSEPMMLSGVELQGTNLVFHASGLVPGKTNVLEGSSNMINWFPIWTNVTDSGSIDCTNCPSGCSQFFRIMQVQ